MTDHEAQRDHHLQRALAWGQSLPTDGALSHESAALIHGLPVYCVPPRVKATRPRGRAVSNDELRLHIAQLRPQDVVTVAGVRVTSRARTVVDLARSLTLPQALITADAAMRRGTSRRSMEDVLHHQWLWPRVRRAMPVVVHAERRSDSPLESFVRGRMIALRLPLPRVQVDVADAFGWVARVDFLWDEHRLIGEADGRLKYGGAAAEDDALWREKQRQDALEEAGFVFIRWTWHTAHAPDQEFATRILRGLRRGELWQRVWRTA